MRFVPPKVYPITDARLTGLSHAEQVKRLIDGGATLVQVRDKHASPREFYREVEAAFRVASEHNVRLIVNDRVDIALALQVDGVHVGQADLPADAARALLGDRAIIGLSTHNIEQIRLAVQQPVDYIAFGPIFQTETKDAPDPTTGLEALKAARQLVNVPIVAIGGISRTNAASVIEAGADSVATISGVLAEPDSITENLCQMLASVQNSRFF